MKPLKPAHRMARVLGTTVARCEEMIRAGNAAGLSTTYMIACVTQLPGKFADAANLKKGKR